MGKLKIYVFLSLLLFLASCGMDLFKQTTYKVALDPLWENLNIPGRELSLKGFSIELVEEIGKIENIKISVYDKSWNDLVLSLEHKNYDGILSKMESYIFHEKTYDFSDPYLLIGPALVLQVGRKASSLDDLKGKEIAVIKGSQGSLILEKYPDILQRSYESIAEALNQLAKGVVDGAVVDGLSAYAYSNNLYKNQLKVAFFPLNQESLRLITLHGNSTPLIEAFNRGLKTLKKNGTYTRLTQKWNLPN